VKLDDDTPGRAVRMVTICEPNPLTALLALNVAVAKVQVAAVSAATG
jgi:hypothetical protein